MLSVSGNVLLHIEGKNALGEEKDMGFLVVELLLAIVAELFVRRKWFDRMDFAYEGLEPREERVRRFGAVSGGWKC